MQYLKRFEKKDKSLWQKFKDAVVNILNKLKKAYAELNPQSEAAQALMNAQDKLENIKKLWVEGVVAAAEVSDKTQTNKSQAKGKNSDRDVDNYTEKEYNDFGWARANGILSANENEALRSLFASAVSKHSVYPKTKSGEFMIAVGDEVKDKIAYMHGTIDNPVISRVLQIYAFDETELSEIRRMVYEIERRGIKQQTSEVFELYNAFDFRNYDAFKRRFSKGQRYSDEFRTDRGRGSETVDGVEKQHSISTKNSDRTYLEAVEQGDMETAQKMVDEAAKKAGYTEEVFHGMRNRHNVYKSGDGQYGAGVYFTYDESIGRSYGNVVDHLFVKVGKIANYDDSYKALGKTDDQTLDEFANVLGFPSFDEMIEDWDNDPTDVASNSELIELLKNKGFEGFVDEGNAGFVLWDFDGIEYRIKSADPVTYDDDGNVIPLSERFKAENNDIRYQDRLSDEESFSNRSILANALESTVQHEVEQKKLDEYRSRIAMLDAEEAKLSKLKAKIKELTFGEKRDPARLKEIKEEARKTEARIDLHDKKLLQLESTTALKNVLERARKDSYEFNRIF